MDSDLNIETLKLELIQWLATIEDTTLLKKISDLLAQEQKKDWWSITPTAEKESVEKGIADADAGKLKPHTEARAIYGKWL